MFRQLMEMNVQMPGAGCLLVVYFLPLFSGALKCLVWPKASRRLLVVVTCSGRSAKARMVDGVRMGVWLWYWPRCFGSLPVTRQQQLAATGSYIFLCLPALAGLFLLS